MDIQPVLDLLPGAGRFDERQPIAAGVVSRLSQDLDNVARSQFVTQGHDAPVYFGPDTGIAYLRMDVVGEVDGGRFPRKNDDLAFWREGINLFGEEIDLEVRDKFLRV